MIFAVVIIGILLIDIGLQGTEHELATQLQQDFTGSNGFIAWFGAIVIIGFMGFIPGLEKPTRYLLALVLVAIVLANPDFANNLVQGIEQAAQQGPAPGQPIQVQNSSGAGGGFGSSGSSGGSGGSGDFQTAEQYYQYAELAALFL